MISKLLILTSFVICIAHGSSSSEESPQLEEINRYFRLDSPYRMNKLNLFWNKARTTLLDESKLKSLYNELKLHEKEEFSLKRLKSENLDKEGLREAQVRKKFKGILNKYGLGGYDRADHADQNETVPKRLFKNKKLNSLWDKAQRMGLGEDQLMILEQEFKHHQEQIDEYHSIAETVHALGADDDGNLLNNHLNPSIVADNFDEESRRKSIKRNYNRLHELTLNASAEMDFKDPKVYNLWKLANDADFNEDELDSLRTELKHFEKRMEKLSLLEAEMNLVEERHGENSILNEESSKTEGRKIMDKKILKHAKTLDKIRQDLHQRISSRHSEL